VGRVGYEIPFTRHFYEYDPPRPLDEIEGEIKTLEEQIQDLMKEVID
jgi:type I restriction enzyme M protein